MPKNNPHFSTQAIHAAENTRWQQNAVMPPIYLTTTFAQNEPGVADEYDYTRAGNPNFTLLEKTLASLEQGAFATVFSSGLGGMTALLTTLRQGDTVVALEGMYGGTYRLLTQVFAHLGLNIIIVSSQDQAALEKALIGAKLLCFETPSNPLLALHDISSMATAAHRAGALCVVDNTFATPYNQNPLLFGADIVWHSTTKYIAGHSDTMGGVMITNDASWKQKFDFSRKAIGVNPSPFDCWLITRGVKTLAVRMERHAANAALLAKHLHKHKSVRRIYYPGLNDHPDHALAVKQMRTFGGMLSIDFDLPPEKVKSLITKLRYFKLAESLGGVESLVCHPATMTHTSLPADERQRLGITDTLVRFSLGIEEGEDLLNDLESVL
jgi:cystathionine beta-lyase/cystathionine gamma-synthase